MAAYEESINRGGYVPFKLNRNYNLDTFGSMIDTINKQHEQALEQRNKIKIALGQLNLNEAEDEWKDNYIRDIVTKIDNAARFGNYSTALDTAIKLAGDVAIDPNIIGRVRANEQYQAKRKQIEALAESGKINSVTRDRWLDQNKYKYVPVTDSTGRVVGSEKWEDVGFNGGKIWDPVQNVNITGLAAIAEKFVKPKQKSWNNSTTDANGIMSGGSGSYEIVTEERLDAALNSAFESVPGSRESLMQDYKDNEWLLEKLENEKNNTTDEEEKQRLQKEIDDIFDTLYKKEGNRTIKLDAKEYMTKRVSPLLHQAAYNWKTSGSISKEKKLNSDNPANLNVGDLPAGMANYDTSGGANQIENMPHGNTGNGPISLVWFWLLNNTGNKLSQGSRGKNSASNVVNGYE